MKAKSLLILLGTGVIAVLGQRPIVSGTPSADSAPSMTIRGEVANIRVVQGNITFELGGSWRRRFVVVISETDVLIPYSEVIRRFRNRTVEVDGLVLESRGRYEVHIKDLDQMKLHTADSDAAAPTSTPTVVSTMWPGDFAALAKEIKKLNREVTNLKRLQQEQERKLSRLTAPATTPVVRRDSGRDYRDLEHRIRRVEVALDLVVQAVQ